MTTETHPYADLHKPDTNNATWFNPNKKSINEYWGEDEYWEESSAFRFSKKLKWWQYLGELNDGIRNGKRTHDELFTYLDNSDLIENVSLQLDLPKCYWPTVKRYYNCIHGEEISGVRKDSTAVAIVEYVIHTRQEERPFHPNTKLEGDLTVAEYLADRFSLPVKTIYKRYGQVAHLIENKEMTPEKEIFDQRNMSRRPLYEDGTGSYTGIEFNAN